MSLQEGSGVFGRLRGRLQRWLIRRLARGQGEVQAWQALRQLREIARFAAVFGGTILLPALILAGLALSSIRSSELQFDADLRARADVMAENLHEELADIFERFRVATAARLASADEPLLENLDGLSPYLRGAYRFDASGRLVQPFEFAEPSPVAPPNAAWQRLITEARLAEATDPHRAARLYGQAATTTREPTFVAEAQLGRARALYAAQDHIAADQVLEGLRGQDWSGVRQTRGFRVGDLASLMRAERIYRRDPREGTRVLMDLSEHLMSSPWAIGQPDPAVLRRTLQLLGSTPGAAWQARMKVRLLERQEQLRWTERVQDELELINNRTNEQGIRYIGARVDSEAVWATVRTPGGLYAFSFSVADIHADLVANASRAAQMDPDLVPRLLFASDPVPEDALTSRPLDPWLGFVRVVVQPRDATALAQRKSTQSRLRLAVVSVALFMVGVGVLLSARLIGRELESARMKADFAANVSHELRSPITQIRLKGEALQLGLAEPGEDMQQHFDAIVRESERLSRLVDNVLDFAAIERGVKKYQLRPDDLALVVWQTVESNRATIESRGMRLDLDIAEDLPPVWMDRDAIGQVLVNLLSNAAKYGADGGWVGVFVRHGFDAVEVSVSDLGMGIEPKDQDRIFDHFYRSTDPKVRRRKGTGIGLTIVRYIVEAHGGTISVDSKPEHGTTFTITFPLEPPGGVGDRT